MPVPFASLVAAGIYGLTLELTGRIQLALGAAAFYTVIPANYRTLGFILIREDFALPWFALHAYLLARAIRCRSSSMSAPICSSKFRAYSGVRCCTTPLE